jgi:hypothetical protein
MKNAIDWFEPLIAPELPAPPGLVYSDGIACYLIMVAFRGNAEALQKRMPRGWKVSDDWGPGPAGMALKGANAFLSFHDTLLESKKAQSKSDPQGRFAIMAMVGRNDSTGERCGMSFTGFSADPENVPGKYKDRVLVKSIARRLSLTGDASNTEVSEGFDIDAGDGLVHFALDYRRPMPIWQYSPAAAPGAITFRAAQDADILRYYWEDALTYVVISRPLNVDCSSKFEFDVTVPLVSDVMRDAEIIAVVIRPYYSRRVFNRDS